MNQQSTTAKLQSAENFSLQNADGYRALIETVARRTMQWNFRMWGFGESIALRGLLAASEKLNEPEFFGFVHALLRAFAARGAALKPEDHVAPGAELLLLFERTNDEIFLTTARKLAALHLSFPANEMGARTHRPDLPGWRRQIWVDCMDAEAPFIARLGAITNETEFFDQAANELLAYARILQDERSGLFRHGYESDCGINGQIWARGNGWALMGLTETLTLLPAAHPARAELHERLLALCRALVASQDQTGLWRTVVDNSETYLESTLAAMTAFSLRAAADARLLEFAEFAETERRAREAVLQQIKADGTLDLVSDATPVGELKMYATRPFGFFPWGQGPLLLMLCQEIAAANATNL